MRPRPWATSWRIPPALLFTEVIGLCDGLLHDLKRTRRHPVAGTDIAPREAFRRFGADEWDRLARIRVKRLRIRTED